MLIVGILLMLVIFGCGAVALAACESVSFGRPAVWKFAALIAAVRVGAVWLGLGGLQRSDWWQIPAQFAFLLGWPELYLARSFRSQPLRWAVVSSVILAATSVFWSLLLLWGAGRIARRS